MPRITTQYDTTNLTGKFFKLYEGDTAKTEVSLPTDVLSLNQLPVFEEMNGRLYTAGQFSKILVFNEFEELSAAGIPTPNTPPTIAASGSGSLTLLQHGYFSYVHKQGDVVLAQSNLSEPSAEVNMSGAANRVWTLPSASTQAVAARATHIRGWLSAGGSIPRLVWERVIGTTSVTEGMSAARLAFQEAWPNAGDLGSIVLNRNPPPYAKFIKKFHRRMYYAGDPNHPSRVWWSELDEPEAVGANSFEETRDGEPVTGLARWNDWLIVFCDRAIYYIQGWTDGSDGIQPDIKMTKVISGPGCISHHSIVDINDKLWFADRDGVRIWDGGPGYLTTSFRKFWRDDLASNPAEYFRCQAINDKFNNTYLLLVPKSSAFYYKLHYLVTDPVMGGTGREPWWTIDKRTRKDTTLGMVRNADGTESYWAGSCDGFLRALNDSADTNDDSDTLAKQVKIEKYIPAYGPGGGRNDGSTLKEYWTYCESETYPWNAEVFSGDESALDQGTAVPSDAVAASAVAGKVAKDVHLHPGRPRSGRGFGFRWTTNTTDGVDGSFKWRGFGAHIEPHGSGARGPV